MNSENQIKYSECLTALSLIKCEIRDVEAGARSGLSALYWLQSIFEKYAQELSGPGKIASLEEYKIAKQRGFK